MTTIRFLRSLTPSTFFLGVGAMTGVACAESTVAVPLALPSMTIDLDAPRVALEEQLCRNDADFDCGVLADLDASDGEQGFPFTLPELLPLQLRTAPGTIVDVPKWFADVQMSADEALDEVLEEEGIDVDVDAATKWMPSQIVPLSIDPSAFARLSPSQLEGLTIQQAHVDVANNDLSVDLPKVDIYLGRGFTTLDDGTLVPTDRDAAVHIAQSAAHAAGEDGVAEIEFASGAVAAMITALQGGDAWLELVATDDVVTLLPGDVKNTLRRPGGQADLAVQLRLGIPVAVADLMALASTGTEGLDAL